MTALSNLSKALSERAEAVCRHYLPNGERVGRYWIIGDARNAKGSSMKVRLYASKDGVAGRWVDYASGEYGDMLDVIRLSQGMANMRDAAREAETFLSLPQASNASPVSVSETPPDHDKMAAVKRLWSSAKPIAGTLAERYLQSRGIILSGDMPSLRFHPRCFFKSGHKLQHLPAMIAAFTNDKGDLTGLHRTFLDVSGTGKTAIENPRKAMGEISGSSIRFPSITGCDDAVHLVGEGIETVLSLRMLIPTLSMQASGSSSHLAADGTPR